MTHLSCTGKVARIAVAGTVTALCLLPGRGQAQQITGRVLDSATGVPVQTAGVFLLDKDRTRLALSIADSLGRYVIDAPAAGEYFLYVQRMGYYETETPLLAIADGGAYALDLEIRPEPIALDPLLVTVRNDQLDRWTRLRFGGNQNEFFGYRVIQGLRLEEAKLRSEDNTEFLRWLYIGVSHATDVCLGSRMPEIERGTGRIMPAPCGKLWVDDFPVPAEHLDTIDLDAIAVVIVLPPNIHVYTRAFDWTGRPNR